ncbi:alpha/beta fold hydrolase [Nonomuraea angiospora]|uniref:Pimeloyl-ACP methyl ester carboxylesterase n=1 Tax=Nonomuraea angiospora TaxID=46172 RepID=A0ABR9ME16_9ACTN|nr:alpha/beta fold hydrolase [Nonomuraea angiospora]MBE1591143.1 pimeloyl-ACP methyl ester carboxylesterase [Nonomuraea angiospora]
MAGTLTHGEQLLKINGAELCVETFGDRADPAILLVAGSAASMLWWDAELCERIAAADRYVIRYDHRDTGRSTGYPPGEPAYSFTDLTLDVLGIQDALGIERAHVVCQSMFGRTGLILGVDHPERVASLTFMSGSTGADDLPPPSSDLTMPAEPDTSDAAAVVEYVVAGARAYAGGSPYFDETAIRALVERDVARARSYASTLVNHYAIELDGPARGGFGDIAAPTLVVHGDHDPVLPLPHGEALRDAIPGAQLLVLEGAGHDLPEPVWEDFVSALVRHTERDRA